MIAINKANWKVKIIPCDQKSDDGEEYVDYHWFAETDDDVGLFNAFYSKGKIALCQRDNLLTEGGAKNRWKIFARENKIKNWEWNYE